MPQIVVLYFGVYYQQSCTVQECSKAALCKFGWCLFFRFVPLFSLYCMFTLLRRRWGSKKHPLPWQLHTYQTCSVGSGCFGQNCNAVVPPYLIHLLPLDTSIFLIRPTEEFLHLVYQSLQGRRRHLFSAYKITVSCLSWWNVAAQRKNVFGISFGEKTCFSWLCWPTECFRLVEAA